MHDELEADLAQYFQIDLDGAREAGSPPPAKLARLTMQLPAGARVWQAVGGWAALSTETQALQLLEFRLQDLWHAYTGRKGKGPKPPEPPKGWLVEQAEAEARANTWEARANAWRAANKDKYAEYQRRMAAQREQTPSTE